MINKLSRMLYIENGMINCQLRQGENEQVQTHFHDFFEIEYIVEGSGTCFIDGKKYAILPGMVFFMSPVNTHKVFLEKTEYVNISFSENVCSPGLLSRLAISDSAIALHLPQKHRGLFYALCLELSENLSDSTYAGMLLDCILTKLFKDIAPGKSEKNLSTSKKATLYIINNFRKGITLKDTAAYAGLTPAYFSNLFKKETGVSFKEYLDRMRFENAKKLILLSDMTFQQICAESGFSNYENFIRRFKRRYGVTPTDYRKENRKIHI